MARIKLVNLDVTKFLGYLTKHLFYSTIQTDSNQFLRMFNLNELILHSKIKIFVQYLSMAHYQFIIILHIIINL